ncbi:unnamed protein product [Fructobacillus fructosus]|uniref:Uncharacterized protein n=1 Tax=Fructobacillus fructosus TaxID=1631 RepID=A0ABN9YKW8_9LACO|nr:unnamed protein product [Fructobacillus fructosus]
MKKIINKLKAGVLVLGLSIAFAILLAGMIASVGIIMIAIKLAWFGVTL